MVVMEVDVVESTVDVFSRCHTSGNVTGLVDNYFIILYTWHALNTIALFTKRSLEAILTALSDRYNIIEFQVTKTIVALVAVSLVTELQSKKVFLTSDTTPWRWTSTHWNWSHPFGALFIPFTCTSIDARWITLGCVAVTSLPASATLGDNLVCRSFELTHGVGVLHDVVAFYIA
jgi:hypothetical protein